MSSSDTSPERLHLDQFRLFQANFEVRSAPNYYQWDRAGIVTTNLLQKRSAIIMRDAAPDRLSLALENRYSFALRLNSDKDPPYTSIAVTDEKPDTTLKGFFEVVDDFVAVVSDSLEITEFTRIGLRLMYLKEYKTLDAAIHAMLDTKLIQYPPGPHFGAEDGAPTAPQFVLKWENKKKGGMVHLSADTRRFEFNPPAELEGVESFKREIHRVFCDLDYYTIAPVSRGQLSVVDWIKSALHVLRRDGGKFLKGM